MRRMTRILLSMILIAGVARALQAEPYFAARQEVSCNACHVNQTGGFGRNAYGRAYGDDLHTFDWRGISTAAAAPNQASRHLGFSGDLYMGYARSKATDTFVKGQQSLSVQAFLNESVAGILSLRTDGGFQEAIGLVRRLPYNGYLKFGTFHIPYGLMLADDRSYTRSGLGFTYDRGENGLEVGSYPGPFALKAAVFNGNGTSSPDIDKQKSFSTWGTWKVGPLTEGGSYYRRNSALQGMQDRWAVFGWGHLGRLVALGEFDRGWTEIDALTHARDRLIAAHGSLETDLGRDIFLRLVEEFLNPSYAVGDEQRRTVLGLRLFPVPNIQVQLDFEHVQPQANALLTNAHLFF